MLGRGFAHIINSAHRFSRLHINKGNYIPKGIQAIDWLIRLLTFAVALTVGWNWLLQETELTGPGPYLLAVMTNFGVWVLLIMLIIMGLVVAISCYVLNNLRCAMVHDMEVGANQNGHCEKEISRTQV